ncbi:type II secretion system F family protein [Phenylobacterium soli]|uniref:Secretion system protein n=1 Tax=Phenylobacterium soli TaxID=2170551 RepID=A0A328ARH7_9CAUL|nr:type II secretion system F family protein [Phenylobacterium soli]RAK56134.1 secretion system protein [Phenylobacterium soli]
MTQFLLPAALLFAFLSVVLLVQTSAGLLFVRRDQAARLNRRLTMLGAGFSRREIYQRFTRPGAGSGWAPALLRVLELDFSRTLRRAGVTTPTSQLVAGALAAIAGLWLLSLSFWINTGGLGVAVNAVISLLACVAITGLAGWLWLRRLQRIRLKKIEVQLPIALDVMTRALRAGHPVISAIQLAAEEMGDPLGSEFGIVVDETTYGSDLQEALANFAERSGSPDIYFLAVSIAVQTETGGNLAEILEGLAGVIRSRTSLTQKVRALSSEGRASALFLTVLPALVIGAQLAIHPHVYTEKFSDPIFWPAVGFTAALYFVGWLVIRRIINFKY